MCKPVAAGGLNIINLCIWNRAALLKLLWDIASQKECLWIQWIHSYYIKKHQLETVLLPKTASWVVRKILEARRWILQGQTRSGSLVNMFVGTHKGGRYSISKMYTNPLPNFPRAEWKSLVLQNSIHSRFRFILWLAVQHRLATIERLMKIGIHIHPDCAFWWRTMETFQHLYFECHVTKTVWQRLCVWLGFQRLVQDWTTEVEWMCMLAKRKTGIAEISSSVFAMMVALLWRESHQVST